MACGKCPEGHKVSLYFYSIFHSLKVVASKSIVPLIYHRPNHHAPKLLPDPLLLAPIPFAHIHALR